MTTAKKPGPRRRAGTLSDQVREAIRRQESASAVARESGVNVSVLLRFLSGERAMTTDSLDKVATALGLKLIETARRRPAANRRQVEVEPTAE